MGKYFEVVYSPSVWGGDYAGYHATAPENLISPQFSPALSDIYLYNSEIRSRPQITQHSNYTAAFKGISTFYAVRGAIPGWHTILLANNTLFNWTTLGFASLETITMSAFDSPAQFATYKGVNYWVLGTAFNPDLYGWDGNRTVSAFTPNNFSAPHLAFTGAVNPPVAPQTTFGARFVGTLDDHLLLVSTFENTLGTGTSSFPQRVRWSNSGFDPFGVGVLGSNCGTAACTFDPSINPSAGLADIIAVPDIITGAMFMDRIGYILRTSGITEVMPTGIGTAPFQFNHLWAAQNGIGNLYPYAWAQYGTIGIFISLDQIYRLDSGAGLRPVGGGAREAIWADLAVTTAPPRAAIATNYYLNQHYPAYHLFIKDSTGLNTKVWVLNLETNSWVKYFIPNLAIDGLPAQCLITDFSGLRGGQFLG